MPASPLIVDALDQLFGPRRPTRWVTRERPKIDRIACPRLIRRFIDPDATFLYVPTPAVFETARREQAVAYDIEGAAFSHVGAHCSFDAFIARFAIRDAALDHLAEIVRAADTGRPGDSPQAHGLLAISLGLSARFSDDLAMLEAGLVVYDALYAWARSARDEHHTWTPGAPA
jgi:hypothetical protein